MRKLLIFLLLCAATVAHGQLPSLSGDTKVKVIKSNQSWFTTLDDIGAAIGASVPEIPETEIAFGDPDGLLTSSPGLTYDGDYLHVEGDIDLIHTNAAIVVDDVASSGSSQGGTIALNSKDGAALASGDRLGGVTYGGSTGVGGTAQGASIEAYADGTWSGTEAPTKVVLTTTPDGDLNPVARLQIRENGNAEFLNAAEWRFYDSDNTNYLAFKAGSMSSDRTITWPTDAPSDGDQLTWHTGNTTSWDAAGGGGVSDGDKGDIVVSSSGSVWDIDDAAVALDDIQDLPANTLIGNGNFPTGPPVEIELGSQFTVSGFELTISGDAITNNEIAANAVGNSEMADNAIGNAEMADNAVGNAEMADNAVNTNEITNGAVTAAKINQMSATTGQVLEWNGSAWAPATDDTGGGGFYQTVEVGATPLTQRTKLNFNPTAQINVGNNDDAGNNRTTIEFSIADDAVGTDEIDDGTVGSADLNQMGASTTQALVWNGSAWAAQYILDDQNISDLSADADNWNPTNWATSTTFTVGSDATIRAITGFEDLPGGTERTIVNASSNPIYVPCLHPDSDNANRVVGPNDYIIPPYGGSITIVYSNNYSKWYVKETTFNPANLGNSQPGLFFSQMPGSTNQSDHPFLGLAVSGTGASQSNAVPTTSLPQSWELTSGTTSTGVATIYFPKNANNFTAFGSAHISASAWVYIPALSSGTQRFITQFSIVGGANSTTTAVNNAVGIRYSDNVNSGAWEFFTRNSGGSETPVNTGVTVAANTLYLLTVTIDKARSEARCYVNGTMVGRITATMPSAVVCGTRFLQVATVGSNNKLANLAAISAWATY